MEMHGTLAGVSGNLQHTMSSGGGDLRIRSRSSTRISRAGPGGIRIQQ